MKLTKGQIEEIEKDIEGGWIKKYPHPILPINILSYTRQTQFEYDWTYIRMICRGLIVDNDYNVIAWPFTKFFSYEEIPSILKNKTHRIFEKVDGSMIIAFFYEGKFVTCTLRSWRSDHAIKAKKLFLTKYISFFKEMKQDRTYLFEFVSPDHRIVINYPEDQLFLLGVTDPSLRKERIDEYDAITSIQKPKEYDKNLSSLMEIDEGDKEGFILRYEDGTRFKIKFDKYLEAHKFVFNLSPKRVWEAMRYDNLASLIDLCPNEFDAELQEIIDHFTKRYNDIYNETVKTYDELKEKHSEALFDDGAYFAKIICMYPVYLKSLLFAYNQKKLNVIEKIIWQKIKPKGNELR